MNEVLSLIMLKNKDFGEEKRDKEKNFSSLSQEVSLRDKISNPLLQTLDDLAALYQLVTF